MLPLKLLLVHNKFFLDFSQFFYQFRNRHFSVYFVVTCTNIDGVRGFLLFAHN
jgi:hypothetical protein